MFEHFKKYRLRTLSERYRNLMEQARLVRQAGQRELYRKKVAEAQLVANVIARISCY